MTDQNEEGCQQTPGEHHFEAQHSKEINNECWNKGCVSYALHKRALGSLGLVSQEGLGSRDFPTGPHEPLEAFLAHKRRSVAIFKTTCILEF